VSYRAILPSLAFVAVAACGGSTFSMGEGSDGGADGAGNTVTVTADQAATDAANAYCNRAQACAPAYVTDSMGDVATCAARLKLVLLPVFGSAGTSSTPAQTEACAQAIPQMTCSDLLGRKNPDVCKTLPGALADGAACSADSQCAGTRCKVAANAVCGTCTEPAAAGGVCGVDDDCQPGMTCVNAACAAYGGENASCDTAHPCRPDLGCKSGACTTPSPAGAACQASGECDGLHGVFCNPVSMKCENVSFVGPNAKCGLVSDALVLCTGPGSLCYGATAPSYQGACVAYANDGAACDVNNGPLCNAGAVCAGGACQIPDPASCH
jgi:hypothetical protein